MPHRGLVRTVRIAPDEPLRHGWIAAHDDGAPSLRFRATTRSAQESLKRWRDKRAYLRTDWTATAGIGFLEFLQIFEVMLGAEDRGPMPRHAFRLAPIFGDKHRGPLLLLGEHFLRHHSSRSSAARSTTSARCRMLLMCRARTIALASLTSLDLLSSTSFRKIVVARSR